MLNMLNMKMSFSIVLKVIASMFKLNLIYRLPLKNIVLTGAYSGPNNV